MTLLWIKKHLKPLLINMVRKILSVSVSITLRVLPSDADLALLTFTEFDMKGNPYIVIKNVADIQAVMIKDANIDIGNYDRINIRG